MAISAMTRPLPNVAPPPLPVRVSPFTWTGNRKSATSVPATAAATISAIANACSAATASASRTRVAGWRGVNSVQQS